MTAGPLVLIHQLVLAGSMIEMVGHSTGPQMKKMKNTEAQTLAAAALLFKSGTTSQYLRNKVIYSQGDKGRSIFYIRQGIVTLSVRSKHHRPAAIAVLGVGNFFNELCLLDYPRFMSRATATTDCSILEVRKKEMVRLLARGANVSSWFRSCLLDSIMRCRQDLTDALVSSSERRLARLLLRLADLDENGGRAVRLPRISQKVLSEIVGTTRSRTSYFMNRFRKLGHISYNGGLTVHRSLRSVLPAEG